MCKHRQARRKCETLATINRVVTFQNVYAMLTCDFSGAVRAVVSDNDDSTMRRQRSLERFERRSDDRLFVVRGYEYRQRWDYSAVASLPRRQKPEQALHDQHPQRRAHNTRQGPEQDVNRQDQDGSSYRTDRFDAAIKRGCHHAPQPFRFFCDIEFGTNLVSSGLAEGVAFVGVVQQFIDYIR